MKKILGVGVVTLMIAATVLPVVGSMNVGKNVDSGEQMGGLSPDNDWFPTDASNTDPIYHMGPVGIGTMSPIRPLHIYDSIDILARFQSSDNWAGIAFADMTGIATILTLGGNLWIDATEVGIGTSTPSSKLEVAGKVHSTSGGFGFPDGTLQTTAAFGDGHSLDAADGSPTDVVYVDNDGNVGIGKTSPTERLEVEGTVKATAFIGDGSGITGVPPIPDDDWTISGNNVYRNIGNVGIGTDTPTERLEVEGTVKATAFKGDGSELTGISGTTDNDWQISGDDVYKTVGNVGIGTDTPSYKLDVSGSDVVAQFSGRVKGVDAVNDDEFVTKSQVENTIRAEYTPTGTDDANGNVGDTAWDDNYFYVKTNDGWKRAAFGTWTGTENTESVESANPKVSNPTTQSEKQVVKTSSPFLGLLETILRLLLLRL